MLVVTHMLAELDRVRKERGCKFRLEVDGGVDLATAAKERNAASESNAGPVVNQTTEPQLTR